MDKSKIEKEELKYEEKKAKQREKRRYQPNAGTGARGYGIFKRERLFPESKKQSSSQLPKKTRVQIKSQSINESINENLAYVVPTDTVEATSKCNDDFISVSP